MPSKKQSEPIKRTHTPATGKSAEPTQGPGGQSGNAAADEQLSYTAPAGEQLPPVLQAAEEGQPSP